MLPGEVATLRVEKTSVKSVSGGLEKSRVRHTCESEIIEKDYSNDKCGYEENELAMVVRAN
jgi:hypothetical protein